MPRMIKFDALMICTLLQCYIDVIDVDRFERINFMIFNSFRYM